jgi:hypothetical protein
LAKIPLARLAWIQLFKRSPVNLRGLTRVTPTANPVSMALAARTYLRVSEAAKCKRLIQRLLQARCSSHDWGRGAWGYPFEWQAKAFYVPLGTPNVIATAYAMRALVECASMVEEDLDIIIRDSAEFVASTLTRQAPTGHRYIGYVPGADTMVHNASIWGAFVLSLGWRSGGPQMWRDLADSAIDYSVRAQSDEGRWCYGEASHHQFTDGFHTGYMLEALDLCRELLGRTDLDKPIGRGLDYYLTTFLRPDGKVPYYSTGGGPLDANNFAQMVITLERLRPMADWGDAADRVLCSAIGHLWLPDKRAFAYQRTGRMVHRIIYPRWTQVWMMHALGLRLLE